MITEIFGINFPTTYHPLSSILPSIHSIIRKELKMDTMILTDESKYSGRAENVFAPATQNEIKDIVSRLKQENTTLTVHGALTGITGSGVPSKGYAMTLQKLNKLDIIVENDQTFLISEAGASVEQIEQKIRQCTKNSMFCPSLPTEKSATLGGIIASGSKGIQIQKYGELKKYITEITLLNADNQILTLTKNDDDFSDIFHSEGMFGIILSAKIQLLPKSNYTWGLLFPFTNDKSNILFTEQIDKNEEIIVIEYMDQNSIRIVEQYKSQISSIAKLPTMSDTIESLLYIEIDGKTEEELIQYSEQLLTLFSELNEDPDSVLAFCTEHEIEHFHSYRHAISECINMEISKWNSTDHRIHKLSLDTYRPVLKREELLSQYRQDLAKTNLTYCIFGHFGVGGPYVNIIPTSYDEYKQGLSLMEKWIKKTYEEQNDVFLEHGIGKLKKNLFQACAPTYLLEEIIVKKNKWDKNYFFNPNNIID